MSKASEQTPSTNGAFDAAGPAASPTDDAPRQSWDGVGLLAAFTAATEWLSANRDAVNTLNVFPVPDGDTGTNMVLTMRAALEEANKIPLDQRENAGEVAARIAHGALLGARGNSGVILSQVFRGISHGLAGRDVIDGDDIARALLGARDMAYRAVMKPVEGTMLTVVRVAAERAETAASARVGLLPVLAAASAGAVEALASTPDLLDILKQAGVVDAGGQGIVHILEGIGRFARGESLDLPADGDGWAGIGVNMAFLDNLEELHGEDAFGYCTNFMIFGDAIDFESVRTDIAAMGESAVIVGDDKIVKVHIHVLNPGIVLDYAVKLGELEQIKIDNMQGQTSRLTAEREMVREMAPPAEAVDVGPVAILAVAPGAGLAEALRSMGAAGIVRGGQTDNPSTQEILESIERVGAADVIVLPNNPNVILSALQAASMSAKRVSVIPTRSVPQGLAALEAFNGDDDLDGNIARMTDSVATVRTIELTRAVRDATISDIAVAEGEWIVLVDDRLVASGADEDDVIRRALAEIDLASAELVTVFLGAGSGEDNAGQLEATLLDLNPDLEIQILDGGQAHYRYIIGIQ